MSNDNKLYVRTPVARAVVAMLNRRDRKFAKEGEAGYFRVAVEFDVENPKHKAFLSQLAEFEANNFAPAQVKSQDFRHAVRPSKRKNEDGDLVTQKGKYLLEIRSYSEVPLFDAQGRAVDSRKVNVGSGSLLALHVSAEPGRKKPGVKFYLNKVQIAKLVEFTPRAQGRVESLDDAYMEEDAFVAGGDVVDEADDLQAEADAAEAPTTSPDLDDDLPF